MRARSILAVTALAMASVHPSFRAHLGYGQQSDLQISDDNKVMNEQSDSSIKHELERAEAKRKRKNKLLRRNHG